MTRIMQDRGAVARMAPAGRRALLLAGGGAGLALALMPGAARPQVMRNVIDTLAADGRFNRLVELFSRAGMVDRLRGAGPFTIFAPTDAAFAGANASRIEELLSQGVGGSGGAGGSGGGGTAGGASPDPVRLPAFVSYFIVPGQAISLAQLMAIGQGQVPTMNGSPLAVRALQGEVPTVTNPAPGMFTGGFGTGGLNVVPPAPIVQADIPATNGVIHALGGVPFA